MRLDASIATWVSAPLLILVLLVTFARNYAVRIISPPPEGAAGIDEKGLRQRNVLARAARLRAAGGSISFAGWTMRREWLVGAAGGKLLDKDVADANPMAAMSGTGQMDMIKMQLVNMASQMGVRGGRGARVARAAGAGRTHVGRATQTTIPRDATLHPRPPPRPSRLACSSALFSRALLR